MLKDVNFNSGLNIYGGGAVVFFATTIAYKGAKIVAI